jgi:hypothetical protein
MLSILNFIFTVVLHAIDEKNYITLAYALINF